MICIESFGIVEQEQWCSTPLEEIFSVASSWANVEKAANLHRRNREAVAALDQGEEPKVLAARWARGVVRAVKVLAGD